MFCEKCGTKLSDDAKFCERCGASTTLVEEQRSEPIIEGKPHTLKKKKLLTVIIALLCGLALISACVAAAIIIPQREVNAFKEQIQSRSYMDAVATYEALSGEDRTKANKWLGEYILGIEQDYYNGKLDYSTASNRLSELIQFDAVFNQMTQASQNVHLDNQSTLAFEEAKGYADEGKWQEAYLALQGIHIKYRLYEDVAALRDKCAENYRSEVLEQISVYAANKEIDMLIAAKENALEILTDDIEIIQACQAHLDSYVEEILANAAELVKAGDYTGAIKMLTYASGVYPNQEFTSAMDDYQYESTIAHCEALIAQNNLLGAVSELKNLVHMDVRYQSKYSEYGQALVEKTLSAAKAYADKREFKKAIDEIAKAQKVYDCSEFQGAVDNYTMSLPIRLIESYCVQSSDDGSWSTSLDEGDWIDSLGNEHKDSLRVTKTTSNPKYIIYNINGKYVNLAGELTYGSGSSYTKPMIVKIYVDDKLIYTSSNIEKTSQPISFSVNITGGKLLRLEIEGGNDGRCIIDATLS